MGLTAEMAGFLARLQFKQLPPEAVALARLGFTDCIGVILAGWEEDVSHIVRRVVAGSQPARPLNVTGLRCEDEALVHGVAAHAHDYDDTALSGHPSAVLVPAILAEAIRLRRPGEAMVAAYVGGYEIWAEMYRREHDSLHAKGWHPSAVWGAPAAAAAVSVLRGHDEATARRALGIAASMSGGIVANFGTMAKPLQLARAAQSGIVAAGYAGAGLTAADDAMEHELGLLATLSPHGNVDRDSPSALGREWHILRHGLNVKLYPVCYAAHRILDAAAELREEHRLDGSEIEAVEVELGETQAAILRNHRPHSGLDAKFSAEFAMAAMLLAGRCGRAELRDDFVRRADVQAFLPRVVVRTIADKAPDEPALSPFDRVSVATKDGRRLVSRAVSHPRGHFRSPAPREAIWEKFRDCASGMLEETRARTLFERLSTLETLGSADELKEAVS